MTPEQERATIVAWLRSIAGDHISSARKRAFASYFAQAIERGEHQGKA